VSEPVCRALRRVSESATAVPDTSSALDLTLIRRIVARDEHAVAKLYDRHSRLLYSVILRIVRSETDAEDVLQDVFVRVWDRADSYDERLGSPAAWLVRIARNRAIDRFRSRRTRADINAPVDAPALDAVPSTNAADNPEQATVGAAAADAIRHVLMTLPESQRLLIEAAFFDGYTHQELAGRFGMPLGTLKTRIRTGLGAMRERLEHLV
jgi:RNA polymerase sigma-70 factor, ECF subfamily